MTGRRMTTGPVRRRRLRKRFLLPWILPLAVVGVGFASGPHGTSPLGASPSSSAPVVAASPSPTDGPVSDATRREIHRMVFHDRSLLVETVRDALAGYVDRPEGVELDVIPAAEPARLLAGCFDELRVRLVETTVKGLKVRRADFRIRDAILDLPMLIEEKKFRFRKEGRTDLLLAVREDDLNELFRTKAAKMKLRNPHVDFRDGGVRFSGGMKVLFFKNFVKVAGRFVLRNGSEIHFRPGWMNLDFLPVPGFVLRTISNRINPIATFDRFKFKVHLDRIRCTPGGLYLATESMADEMEALIEAEERARMASVVE